MTDHTHSIMESAPHLLAIIGSAMNGDYVSRIRIEAACGLLRKVVPLQLVDILELAASQKMRPYWITKRVIYQEQATPRWADLTAIESIKEACRERSNRTGIKHHVDHIIPLKNEAVCGLHCADNMQIITAKENLQKHNKYPWGVKGKRNIKSNA